MTRKAYSFQMAVLLVFFGFAASGCIGKMQSNLVATASYLSLDPYDGANRAPEALPQFPQLLAGYANRSPWRVAGVEYAVGLSTSGPALANPATLLISGVSVDSTSQLIHVTANNVILDGLDFSLNGGWTIQISGAMNVRISHSRFGLTSVTTSPAILADADSPGLYIGYNVFDGGGSSATNLNPNTLISIGADATIEYNWIKNAPGDLIEATAASSGSQLLVQYNLFDNAGQLVSSEGNFLKLMGGTFSSLRLLYNTLYQMDGAPFGVSGLNLWFGGSSTGNITNLEIGNNTAVVPGSAGDLSFILAVNPTYTGLALIHDNYVDMKGVVNFAYSGSSGSNLDYSNNINMAFGSLLQP